MPQATQRLLDDAAFIRAPKLWPVWPYLPIKRYPKGHSGPECAILVASEHPEPVRVYGINLFDIPKSREAFEAAQTHTYPTVEDLLRDGWVVD